MKKFYALIFTLLFFGSLSAQKIPFQGRLLDGGVPYNGTVTIDFSITNPTWSETISDVSVSDGYYSVVLGETTPLPDTLFGNSREVELNITVNGEALSAVTLHSPLLPYTADGFIAIDSVENEYIRILNEAGHQSGYFRGTTDGAQFQAISEDGTDTFTKAAVYGGTSTLNSDNSFFNMYGLNTTGDGASLLINNYTTANNVFGNAFAGGYRRGGTDYYDNEGRMLAAIGSNKDAAKSGLMMINGPTTRNVYVSGQWWSNGELGIVQVFGQNDDGNGDFNSVIDIVAGDRSGNSDGTINMKNTYVGGTATETVQLGSNNGSGGGWLDLRSSTGATTIGLNGQTGNINIDGTLTESSDRRLKNNIQPLEGSLVKVQQLRGVSYTWKNPAKSQKTQIGVIAQELEEIYPELVTTRENGFKAVNYSQINAILIEAIKELNKKVERLEIENGALKAEVSAISQMQKDIDQLKALLGHSKPASK